ncbi:MAG: SIR2 family protein [Candidatus Odinarchaeota archaeon]
MNTTGHIPSLELGEILPQLLQSGFIAYCGAGISIPPPTCAPGWWTLAEEIMLNFFEQVPEEWEVPKDLIIKDPNFQPEVLFESWANIMDLNLYKVFEALDVTSPNGNHQLLARLAKAGLLKAILTTNFDIYIERALREEGVDFQLLVENNEFNDYYEQLKSDNFGNKVLVCKIHGTIERPSTIIAVASAYKSAKGFSLPKARVFTELLERYPCLFLGYSGWDFEHANYRAFWERTGPVLKKIYWNRRPGEVSGPDFAGIFSNCSDRFVFCEADLPEGMIAALAQNKAASVSLENLALPSDTEVDALWDKTKDARKEFFLQWAAGLPEWEKLTTVMVEGNRHSERQKDTQEKSKEYQRGMDDVYEIVDVYQQEREKLQALYEAQEITGEEYSKRSLDISFKQSMDSLPAKFRQFTSTIVNENKYPGITDDPSERNNLVTKMATLAFNYTPEQAIDVALDLLKRDNDLKNLQIDQSTPRGQKEYYARVMMNSFYASVIRPHDGWKPFWDEMEALKERYLNNEFDQTGFMSLYSELVQRASLKLMGMSVPVEELMKKEIEIVSSTTTPAEFSEGCRAVFLAMSFAMGYIGGKYMQSQQFQAIVRHLHGTLDPAAIQKSAEKMQQQMTELGQQMAKGEITAEEFQERQQAVMKEYTDATSGGGQSVQKENGYVVVPQDLLVEYENLILELFQPVFDAQQRFFGEEITESKILLDLGFITVFSMGLATSDPNSGEQMKTRRKAGQYQLMYGNPSIFRYIRQKVDPWLDKAMEIISPRFGQRMCSILVKLAEMGNDLELCEKATLASLKYTDGKIIEITPPEIPSSLATLYEDRGDKENALKYYKLALEGIKLAIPPMWANAIIYSAALLLKEKGETEEALKTIGELHAEFMGTELPYEIVDPAKKYCVKLAEELAKELGYSDAREAVKRLLE